MKSWSLKSLLIVLIGLSFTIFMPIANALEKGPDAIIETASKTLLNTLNQESVHYASNPQRLYTKIRNQMRPITDIAAIAKGIMGKKYYATATDAQKARFKAAFEQSLVKVYADSLMKIGVKRFEVKPSAPLTANARKRKVVVKVLTNKGDSFLVSYSLLRNPQKQWFIRNIVVDGVNFGLTYRNQFNNEMISRGNNMDDLIAHWNQIVEKK